MCGSTFSVPGATGSRRQAPPFSTTAAIAALPNGLPGMLWTMNSDIERLRRSAHAEIAHALQAAERAGEQDVAVLLDKEAVHQRRQGRQVVVALERHVGVGPA